MAETTHSKGKSKRGGKRPGAGRKPRVLRLLRADWQAETANRIAERLPKLLENLFALADGVKVKGEDGVYQTLPCRETNKYLIDRVLGKPTERTEVGGEDGGPIQVEVFQAAVKRVYGDAEIGALAGPLSNGGSVLGLPG